MPAPNAEQPFRKCSPNGYMPFRPPSRTRSEASFSEFHYDNTEHPPAGVNSDRLWHHYSKDCGDDSAHLSQIERVMRMTPQQEYNCQHESLDGPRLDPSAIQVTAGNLSRETKIKVSLLGQHDGNQTKGAKPKKAAGFILDVSRKAAAACTPARHNRDPLKPTEEKFTRPMKRNGYKSTRDQTWTWNECNEMSGLGPDTVNMHDPNTVLKGLSPVTMKMHTSSKGEKRYNVCGVQDMLPAAQEKYNKGDAPPSARHIYENDKNNLQGFERGRPPKGGGGPEFLAESDGMWVCMAGQNRPLDTWRKQMRGDQSEQSWMDSAESYYSGNGSATGRRASSQQASPRYSSQQGTPRYDMPRNDSRRSLVSSPSQSEYSEQFQVLQNASLGQSNGNRTRTQPGEQFNRGDRTLSQSQLARQGNRRSLQSSPAASEFSAVQSARGSRTSRASARSSQMEFAQRPRWN